MSTQPPPTLIIEMFEQISVKCKAKPHLLSCLKIVQNSTEKIKPQERSSHVPIIVVHAHKFAVDSNKGPSNPSLTRLNGEVVSCIHKAKYIIFM